VKFDGNNTKDENGNYIAVSEIQSPRFIINYDDASGLFSCLEKIYANPEKTSPVVNLRMSKVDRTYYL